MFPPHPTALLHTLLQGEISPGDLVIDATAGNGHDTAFLAHHVGPFGKVIAFDIQPAAIEATRNHLEKRNLLSQVTLVQKSHTHLADYASPASVKAVVFNLGYLPGDKHGISTSETSTLLALTAAATTLQLGGILAAICYPGHPAGAAEAQSVTTFFHTLPHHRTASYSLIATKTTSPILFIARNGRKKIPT